MNDPVIIIDSDDEDVELDKNIPQESKSNTNNLEDSKSTLKRKTNDVIEISDSPEKKIRRIQPTKIGEVSTNGENKQSCETFSSQESDLLTEIEPATDDKNSIKGGIAENGAPTVDKKEGDEKKQDESFEDQPTTSAAAATASQLFQPQNTELSAEVIDLIKACKHADNSTDMKRIVKKKFLKYHFEVSPKYTSSRKFLEMVKEATVDICKRPYLVYSRLSVIIEELDARRKRKVEIVEPTAPELPAPTALQTIPEEASQEGESSSADPSMDYQKTGDKEKDLHLKKLYSALVKAKRLISDLEEQEVDWDEDDNSSYLKKNRYEKRACEIYDKICAITGESNHAHRIAKKPIKLKEKDFPEFYKRLQTMVNKSGGLFPNYRDVLKVLDLCNKKYQYRLSQTQQGTIARVAFEKLGKILQERRMRDLYESASHYAGKSKDPAKSDVELRAKLEKNKKHYAKMDELIDEYAIKKEEKFHSDDSTEVTSTSKIEEIKKEDEMETQETSSETETFELKEEPRVDENNFSLLDDDDDDDDEDLKIIS